MRKRDEISQKSIEIVKLGKDSNISDSDQVIEIRKEGKALTSKTKLAKQSLVKARCSLNKKDFLIEFIHSDDGSWLAEKSLTITEQHGAKSHCGIELTGIYIGPRYSGCPHCKNMNFFLCNKCKTLNCQGSSETKGELVYVSCAVCGPVGFLQGVIEKLEGLAEDIPPNLPAGSGFPMLEKGK